MTALKKGFTLIELLIVMSILGVLAVVVLVAINPAEQMRRARDTGKISGVQQLGRAAVAYYTATGTYPDPAGDWIQTMVDSGDIATVPADPISGGDPNTCSGTAINNWCYDATLDQAAVWVELAAERYIGVNACDGPAFAVFSTVDARGGWGCSEPTAGVNYDFE